jgi:hypothetical protein
MRYCSPMARRETRPVGGAPTSLTSQPDRFLFVVSRTNTKLANYLQLHFSGDTTVKVVIDWRFGERRQHTVDIVPERRRADRRSRPHVDKELRLTSFAIVTLPAPERRRDPFSL